MQQTIQFDRQKFKAVIHNVCASTDPALLGKVKLHKILYFADMLHFLDKGIPLTGAEYQKQQFGPVAKHLSWALEELRRDGILDIRHEVTFGFPIYEFVSLAEPNPSLLTVSERALLAEVSSFVSQHSARAISDLSHNAAWSMARMGEVIPYFTAYLLVPCEVTERDIAWGEREAGTLLSAA